jgi:hypothetical protein
VSAADDLIRELASDGRTDSEGAFTLDREKARDKMRLFQLADPVRYVLELVQAAMLKGASRIRFDIDADDMLMRCDGTPFTVEDFEDVYGSLLSKTESPVVEARRELCLGLNAAMALNPRFIRVESGGAYLLMRPGKDDEYGALEAEVAGTSVHVKQRFRAGLLVEFFRNLSGRLAEEYLLRERCVFCPVPVDLEGEVISRGLELPRALATARFEIEGVRGVIGLSHTLLSRKITSIEEVARRVHIVVDGVVIVTHDLPELLPGTLAVVVGSRLRKDVSQSDIVRDEEYDRLVAALRDTRLRLLEALCDACRVARGEELHELLETLLRWYLEHSENAVPSLLDLLSRPAGDPGRRLLRVPLWTSIRGERLSLEDVLRDFRKHGDVAVGRSRVDDFPRGRRDAVVLVESDLDRESVERLFPGQVEDWTDAIDLHVRRVRNKRAWLMRPMSARLPSVLARRPIDTPSARGEVGVRTLNSESLRLALIANGCLLVEHDVPFPVLGISAVIEADFEPNDTFDDVEHDESHARAMLALLEALVPLLHDLAATQSREPWVVACLLSFLDTLSARVPIWNALVKLGVTADLARAIAPRPARIWNIRTMLGAGRGARAGEGHAIRFVPLLPTWNGPVVSPEAVRQDLETHGHVRTVTEDLPVPVLIPGSIPQGTWDRAAALAYAATPDIGGASRGWDRPVLRMTKVTRRVLDALDLKWTGVCFDGACDHVVHAAEFFERSTSSTLIPVPTVASVMFQHGSVEGEVGLLPVEGDLEGEGRATLLWHYRRLGSLQLGMPFSGLTAVVASADVQPDDAWTGAVEDEATGEVRKALARAVVQLVRDVAGMKRARQDLAPTASWLLATAAAAAFPEPVYRELYDALVASRAREVAEEEYRAVLDLATATSYSTVARTLRTTSWTDRGPDVETIIQAVLPSSPPPPGATVVRTRVVPPPGAMAWLDELYPVAPDRPTPSLAERVLDPIHEITSLEWFETVRGDRLSIGDVIDLFRENGPVQYVGSLPPGAFESDRTRLLVADDESKGLLHRLFGRTGVVEDTAWLEEQRQRWLVSQLPRHDDLRLPPGSAIVTAEIATQGLAGEVGLDASHPVSSTAGIGPCICEVVICKDRVEIGRDSVVSPIALTAIIDDEGLVMSPTWDKIATDPMAPRRRNACLEKLPELAGKLAVVWPRTAGALRAAAAAHALDLLTTTGEAALQGSGPDGEAAWQALAELPLFRTVDGGFRSLRGLLRLREERKEPVWYLPDAPLSPRGKPLDENRVVLVLTEHEVQRLRLLATLEWSDYSAAWREERAMLAWMASAPPLPRIGELEAVHRSSEGLPPGTEGELVIPRRALDQRRLDDLPTIAFGVHGRLVERRSFSEHLPCSGTITGTAVTTSADRTRVRLDIRFREAFSGAIVKLYSGLCERFERGEITDPGDLEVARSVLGAAVVLLVRARKHRIARYRPLFERLAKLPVLLMSSGRAVSFEVAQEQRPRDLGSLGLWHDSVDLVEREALAMCEGPPGTRPVPPPVAPDRPADPPLTAPEASPEPRPAPEPSTETTPGPAPDAPPKRAPESAPARPSREELLLEAVRDELRVVRERNEHLLSEVNLEQLRLGDGPRDRLVSCEPGSITVNRRHPVAKVAVDHFDRDSTWTTFLVVAVYSALNTWLEDITDEDEGRFLELLVEHVSTGLPAPSGGTR